MKIVDLKFIEVDQNAVLELDAIYEILKKNGEYLFNTKGLRHWKTPYSKKLIKEDIKNKKVFIVEETEENQYVHTFQLEVKKSSDMLFEKTVQINKFATEPAYASRGIGTKSLQFIEKWCRKNNIRKIKLDVYDESLDAINFYKSKNFYVVESRKTKHFNVLVMEKKLK